MNHRSGVAAAFLLALVATVPVAAGAQETPTTVQVSGWVRDSASRRPVPGAVVAVPDLNRSVATDQEGRYQISGLPSEVLLLTVRAIGYAPLAQRVDLTRGSLTVDLLLGVRPIELDTIVVSGERGDSTALHNEQAIAVMSAAEVARDRGQTIGETLKELPGVTVIQYGPSIAKPVVRGLHSQRVRVMNGDVPQEGQQWGEEHAPEIDAFAANEVEVIRGSGTVLYGSDALGGVVRVLPRPLPQTGHFGGLFSTNVFSNNHQGAGSLLLEGSSLGLPVLGRLGWRVQGTLRRAGDAQTPDYYLPNTGFEEKDASAAIGLSRSWGTSQLIFSHFGTDLGMYLGAHVTTKADLDRAMKDPLTSDSFSYTIGRPYQTVKHDLLSWRTELVLPPKFRLELNYSYQHNTRSEYDGIGFASGSTRPAFGLELYTHTLDLRLHHAPMGRFAGTFGLSGMRQGNLSPGRSFLIPQYRLYAGGVYGLEQVSLSQRWTLTAGLRYDHRWQHAYQYGDPVVISPDDERTWDGFSGSLSSAFQLGQGWSLAGSIGRTWRAPNVAELHSAGVHHGTAQYELGDSTIQREDGLNVDMTLRHISRSLRFEVSAYQNRINDYIFLRPFGDVSTVRGTYPGYRYDHTNARLRGVEASALFSPDWWWSFYVSGTLVRGIDRGTGDPLYDMPADRIITNIRLYGHSSGSVKDPYLELGATLVREQDQVPPVTIYKLPTDGYVMLNAEVGVGAVHLAGQPLTASLAVRNLLNVRYRDYLSRYRLFVNDPGRDIVLRLAVPFGDSAPLATQ
jgi:iron complex outermembrane receptor protein